MSDAATLLLAASDAGFRSAVAAALAPDTERLVQVNSGQEALEAYAVEHPDLVLLDFDEPGANPIEVCRTLIERHGEDCAPVIFFARNPAPADVAAAFAVGSADYLTKTATAEEIRARIRSHLQNYVLLKQQTAMAEQLGRANAAKNRFIGMAAHDMRNPLVSIRGFSEFLIDGTVGPMPAAQLALVSIIHGTSNLMIKTLNELLDVATIEAGQLKLQLSRQNLVDLVTKSVAQARIEARKKRSRLEFTPPPTAPVLTMDADKIKQVVDNLLSNAIKFSPPASTITIAVELAPDGSTCRLRVRDQGPGIPESAREKLGKQFGGLSENRSEGSGDDKSVGVGLIITRNIVDAHRGQIAAENLPGKGCEFSVTLPVRND